MYYRFSLAKRFEIIGTVLAWVGGAAIFFTMVYVTADVAARFLLKISIGGGTDQLVSMVTVFVGYMPLSYTMAKNGHVTMTVLTDRMKGRKKLVTNMWIGFYCTLFFLLMFYVNYNIGFIRSFATKEIVEASFSFKLYLWYGRIALPIGIASMIVTSFFMFLDALVNLINYKKWNVAEQLAASKNAQTNGSVGDEQG
jgi:TRAP-type C4-dicarboxylate transport system permease small subunit